MKLLLIGVGYVGMALLHELSKLNHEIYTTTTQAIKVDTLKTLCKDVLFLQPDYKGLKELLEDCEGAIVLVAPKNHQNYEQTYLNTANTIAALLKYRQSPFYLLYTSSTSVYEGVQDEWAVEDLDLHPQSANPNILLATERVYLERSTSCILRLGGIYGPNRELAARARLLSGKELPGTGDEPTNHIHVEDIVSAIALCLEKRLTGIYNVVNAAHPSRKELYKALCQKMHIPSPVWNQTLSQGTRGGYKVSNQKICEAGFTFKHPLLADLN